MLSTPPLTVERLEREVKLWTAAQKVSRELLVTLVSSAALRHTGIHDLLMFHSRLADYDEPALNDLILGKNPSTTSQRTGGRSGAAGSSRPGNAARPANPSRAAHPFRPADPFRPTYSSRPPNPSGPANPFNPVNSISSTNPSARPSHPSQLSNPHQSANSYSQPNPVHPANPTGPANRSPRPSNSSRSGYPSREAERESSELKSVLLRIGNELENRPVLPIRQRPKLRERAVLQSSAGQPPIINFDLNLAHLGLKKWDQVNKKHIRKSDSKQRYELPMYVAEEACEYMKQIADTCGASAHQTHASMVSGDCIGLVRLLAALRVIGYAVRLGRNSTAGRCMSLHCGGSLRL